MNLDAQKSPAVGAGINPQLNETDEKVKKEQQKALPHYLFSPGQRISLADRQVSTPSLVQGRLNLVQNHSYITRNRSTKYIKGSSDEPDMVLFTKYASVSADEIVGGTVKGGRQKVFKIVSLTGVDPRRAEMLEAVLVPEVPPTLKKYISFLSTSALRNIEDSSLDEGDKTLAEKVRQEFLNAARKVFTFQNSYLDKTERELINSRKPNGKGKSNLDNLDKHYYRMCERKMPLESDLDLVADQEAKVEGADAEFQGAGALADAIKLLADRVGAPAQVQASGASSEELDELRAELAETQRRFNELLEVVAAGKAPAKAKKEK